MVQILGEVELSPLWWVVTERGGSDVGWCESWWLVLLELGLGVSGFGSHGGGGGGGGDGSVLFVVCRTIFVRAARFEHPRAGGKGLVVLLHRYM